jgi:PAS domain S-box-containing protein
MKRAWTTPPPASRANRRSFLFATAPGGGQRRFFPRRAASGARGRGDAQIPEERPAPFARLGRFVPFVLSAAVALGCLAARAWCAEVTRAALDARPASIAVILDDNYPPYIFRDQNGQIQGYLVDEWRLWSEKTGVTAELTATDWDKAQRIMAEGGADVIDTIFYNDARAKLYDFSEAYADLPVPVFYHKSLSGITGVGSLKGFSIAVKSGDACIDVLTRNGISTLKEYDSYEDIIKAAVANEVKVFTIDEPPALYYLYKYGLENEYKYGFTLYSGQFHRAVKKGRGDLLHLVETGFDAITPKEREALQKKWLGAPLADSRLMRLLGYWFGAVAAAIAALVFFNLTLRRRVRSKTAELDALMRELAKSEERYRLLFEMESDAILLMTTPEGEILEANQAACDMHGYTAGEMRRLTVLELSAEPHETERVVRDRTENVPMRWHRRKDGSAFPAEIHSRHFELHGRSLRISALRDITARKKAENALLESRKLLEHVLNSIPQAVFWKDNHSVYLGCNQVFARDTGMEEPWHIIGKTDFELTRSTDHARAYVADDREVIGHAKAKRRIIEQVTKADGAVIWVETTKIPLTDDAGRVFGVLGVYEDITDRKLYEEKIENSLREKEVLLKEVHHRVKNNLQILSSLINLQAQSLGEKAETGAFVVMQNRVRSISLVHESLYRSPNLSAVGMRDYLPNLVKQLAATYSETARSVRLDLDVDDIALGVDKGIPLGLLVTELVTNALKHAFAPGKPGVLLLALKQTGDGCRLVVEDNGVGLPDGFDLDASDTLGVQLLSALASQLGGELRISGNGTTRFEVEFPV